MNDTELRALIDRVLTGKASDEENRKLEEWFRTFDDAKVFAGGSRYTSKEILKKALREKIEGKLGISWTTESDLAPKPISKKLISPIVYRVAAVFIFVALCYAGYVVVRNGALDREPERLSQVSAQSVRELVLRDGSRIWLNKGAVVRYPEHFMADQREVFLEGEAYFEVARDEHRPFIIHSGAMTTQVLGTSFNVKANSMASEMAVNVIEGKVKVTVPAHEQGDTVNYLIAGQGINYNVHTGLVTRNAHDNAGHIIWRTGGLNFDNEYMTDIALQLQIRYDLDVVFDDPTLRKLRFTGSFDNRESLDNILSILAKANSIHISKRDQKITFY